MNQLHTRATDEFFKQFESLDVSLGNAAETTEAFGKAVKTVKRTLWRIIVINLVLGLIGTALTVGVVGGVILGLLKLFGVI